MTLCFQQLKHWWPSGLRRYVQVVVYYVGAGSNPAQCTIFVKMTPEGFEPPAFGFGIQRAAVAPWSLSSHLKGLVLRSQQVVHGWDHSE